MDLLRETEPAKKPTFDAVVASPTFSYRWEPTDALSDRHERYNAAHCKLNSEGTKIDRAGAIRLLTASGDKSSASRLKHLHAH